MQPEDPTAPARPPALPPPARTRGVLWFLVIPAVLVIGLALALVLRFHGGRALAASTQAMVAEPVTVTNPQQGAPEQDISLPSSVQANSESPIYARVSGYVARWNVDLGTRVHRGQLLAVISAPEVDQELNAGRAALQQTRANLSLASITAQRYQDLAGTKAVAQQDVDQNNQAFSAQKAGLQAAIANVKRLEELQGFEKVIAPFDGVVTQRLIDVGNLVNAGNGGANSQLFRIADIDVMRVYVPVPEIYGDRITDGLTATLHLVQSPDQQFAGTITRTSHAIDPSSHTLLTEIDVPNPSGKLMPGAYANVQLHLAPQASNLVIPTGAILFQADGPTVAVVGDNNRLSLRKVSIGRDFGNTIEIRSGLSASDRVVATPPDYVVEGMPVSVQPPPGQPSPANAPAGPPQSAQAQH
jgi:RND family efflux transporter MFP subunit